MNVLEIERCEIDYLGRDRNFGHVWSIDFTLENDVHLYQTDIALNSQNDFSIGAIENRSTRVYSSLSDNERDHLLEQFVFLIKKYSKQRVKMIVNETNLIRLSGEKFVPLEQYAIPKEIKIID
jgi:hypothetical protein